MIRHGLTSAIALALASTLSMPIAHSGWSVAKTGANHRANKSTKAKRKAQKAARRRNRK